MPIAFVMFEGDRAISVPITLFIFLTLALNALAPHCFADAGGEAEARYR
jgi:hypothetical protein